VVLVLRANDYVAGGIIEHLAAVDSGAHAIGVRVESVRVGRSLSTVLFFLKKSAHQADGDRVALVCAVESEVGVPCLIM
jgi:hypothetical protein